VPGNNSNFSTTGWPRQQNRYEFRFISCHKGGTAGPDIAMLRRRAPTSVSRKGRGWRFSLVGTQLHFVLLIASDRS